MDGLKGINTGDDPLTHEELTQRVFDLTERVARLEALMEQHQRTFESIDKRFERIEDEIKQLRMEVNSKLDRLFWLWVTTVAAGVILRVLGLL